MYIWERFGLTQREHTGVLTALLRGHGGRSEMNRYGIMQALTAASQEIEDYDRATELERFGGQVLELPRTDWQRLTVQ